MKYENQRPDLADQVKALVQSANSVKTVPHGVKTVNPGEGLQLLSSDGAEIFWDWETANEYDTRISEGRAAIEQARADLDKAEQDLAAASARVDENRALLDVLGPRVDAAQSQVAQTAKDLTAVDTRLTNTSKDLTTLQGTVGDVQSAATAAAQKAAEALTTAGVAQRSADGKNTISASTNTPSGNGSAVGDIHRQVTSLGSGGQIAREWRWNGSTWVEQKVSGDMVTNLDVGKLTGVFANFSQMVRAGSINTDRLVVGTGQESILDPTFSNADLRATRTAGVASFVAGTLPGSAYAWRMAWHATAYNKIYLTGPGNNHQVGRVAARPGDRFRFRVYAKASNATMTYLAGGIFTKTDGTDLNASLTSTVTPGTGGAWLDAVVTIPDGVREMCIYLQAAPGSKTGVAGDWIQFEQPSLRQQTDGALVVDGAITGRHVDAESVAAKVGDFVKVQAINVEVTQSLATRVVNSMTANTKNLVVTESAILQHTTLLGTTVADQLNVRKLISGRDAILSGTLDVAQLNVTGEMSAEIARFMDAEARKLIVTEDAILNRATVVEGLVTSELISKKANIGDLAARMITSGLLQTTTTANRGVKIDNAGIRAWDDSGQQTIRLDGSDNLMQGTFQTGTTGSRIKINAVNTTAFMDLYGNSGGLDHGTIYYDAAVPGKTDAALTLTAIKDYSTNPENPSFRLFPTRGTFAFQGRWASETDPTKFMVIQNNAGLPANAYNTFKIAYSTPFPTKSAIRFPLISVESENGADVMTTIVAQTEKDITINAINKSEKKASGRIILKVVTFNTDNTQA